METGMREWVLGLQMPLNMVAEPGIHHREYLGKWRLGVSRRDRRRP